MKIKMVNGDAVKYCEHDWQVEACKEIGFKEDKPKTKPKAKKKESSD